MGGGPRSADGTRRLTSRQPPPVVAAFALGQPRQQRARYLQDEADYENADALRVSLALCRNCSSSSLLPFNRVDASCLALSASIMTPLASINTPTISSPRPIVISIDPDMVSSPSTNKKGVTQDVPVPLRPRERSTEGGVDARAPVAERGWCLCIAHRARRGKPGAQAEGVLGAPRRHQEQDPRCHAKDRRHVVSLYWVMLHEIAKDVQPASTASIASASA